MPYWSPIGADLFSMYVFGADLFHVHVSSSKDLIVRSVAGIYDYPVPVLSVVDVSDSPTESKAIPFGKNVGNRRKQIEVYFAHIAHAMTKYLPSVCATAKRFSRVCLQRRRSKNNPTFNSELQNIEIHDLLNLLKFPNTLFDIENPLFCEGLHNPILQFIRYLRPAIFPHKHSGSQQ